jgi:hypothetical protein
MAPRRARANSNATRQSDSTAPSDAARYETNLKILRRRDPTIIRIFDQFPHVTVYSYNRTNSKWERYNCEGALFLFERQVAPSIRMGRGRAHACAGRTRIGMASTSSTEAG